MPASASPIAAASRPISSTALQWRSTRCPERREVLSLAVAAGDQHDGLRETVERGLRRRDRGALRIVDEEHAARFDDPLHPVRQPFELGELGEHVALDRRHHRHQRQRGERVLRVVPPDELQLRHGQQQRAAAREPDLARAAVDEPPRALGFRHAGAEGLHQPARQAHRERARIVAVQHLHAAVGEDARLGRGVGVDSGIAVEVVLA